MLLAETVILWVIGFVLVGVFGFCVMIVALAFQGIGWVFRMLTGGASDHDADRLARAGSQRQLICPHPGCGHTNSPIALYCGRCGRSLRQAYDTNRYG